jgi:hypothetical protein
MIGRFGVAAMLDGPIGVDVEQVSVTLGKQAVATLSRSATSW